MSRHEWYRNETWSAEIEAAFFLKLRRARDKRQYLRIQASALIKKFPDVTLRLLEEYFSFGEHFDLAQAYVDQAGAYLALKDTEAALAAYEKALERERQFPNLQTTAYLDFASLVASHRIKRLYGKALEILGDHDKEMTWPYERYKAHGARSIILNDMGQANEARQYAQLAAQAAAETKSGFRYHQNVGLVRDFVGEFADQIRAIASSIGKILR